MGNLSKILIAGTGALACLFAARLSAAGVQVSMLGTWREAIEALRENGVCLVAEDGTQEVYPVRVYDAASDLGRLPPTRLALVLVKSWQTGRAARQLAGCLEPAGLALTLQNGLGNREVLADVLGGSRTALGAVTLGAALLQPGQVRLAGAGKVFLEKTQPDRSSELEAAGALFEVAGFLVEWVSQPESLLWGKLVISAAINPLTAILNAPNGELLTRPTARELMREAALETASVAAAAGIALPYSDPVKAVEQVAGSTSTNLSSMLQDVRRGAPTEIDAISGAIVAAAQPYQAPTPVNRALWQLVKALVQREPPNNPSIEKRINHS